MDWQIPLLVSSAVFVLFLLWKMRPSVGVPSGAKAAALKAARARVAAARNDEERANALCDAGDARAAGLGGADSAIGYYLRAMRTNPLSPELIARATVGLARRPRALESLLWRRLGAEPWTGPGEPAARAAVEALATLYSGPLRNAPRARALEHARALFRPAA